MLTIENIVSQQSEQIRVTGEHPYWLVSEQAWQTVDDLAVGSVVTSYDGEALRIAAKSLLSEREQTYNISVAENENDFAGDLQALVHNCTCDFDPSAPKRLPVPSTLSKTVHDGGQGKHIVGHNNYDPTKGRSILTADSGELLGGVHSGKYPIVRMAGDKPVVDFGKPIGTYGGSGPSTQYGIVHSGKNGAHIVPANPAQQ